MLLSVVGPSTIFSYFCMGLILFVCRCNSCKCDSYALFKIKIYFQCAQRNDRWKKNKKQRGKKKTKTNLMQIKCIIIVKWKTRHVFTKLVTIDWIFILGTFVWFIHMHHTNIIRFISFFLSISFRQYYQKYPLPGQLSGQTCNTDCNAKDSSAIQSFWDLCQIWYDQWLSVIDIATIEFCLVFSLFKSLLLINWKTIHNNDHFTNEKRLHSVRTVQQ